MLNVCRSPTVSDGQKVKKKVKRFPSLLVRPWAFSWSRGGDPRGGTYGLISHH